MPYCLWKLATACTFGTPKASVINYPHYNIPSTSAKGNAWQPAGVDIVLITVVPAAKWSSPHSAPPTNPERNDHFGQKFKMKGENCTWDSFPEAGLVLSKIVKICRDFEDPKTSVSYYLPTANAPAVILCLLSHKTLQVRASHVIHCIYQLPLHIKLHM